VRVVPKRGGERSRVRPGLAEAHCDSSVCGFPRAAVCIFHAKTVVDTSFGIFASLAVGFRKGIVDRRFMNTRPLEVSARVIRHAILAPFRHRARCQDCLGKIAEQQPAGSLAVRLFQISFSAAVAVSCDFGVFLCCVQRSVECPGVYTISVSELLFSFGPAFMLLLSQASFSGMTWGIVIPHSSFLICYFSSVEFAPSIPKRRVRRRGDHQLVCRCATMSAMRS